MKLLYNALRQMEAVLLLSLIVTTGLKCASLNLSKLNTFDKLMENHVKFIQSFIYELAENFEDKSNLRLKKKLSGDLPDSYPERMKIRAKKFRENKENFKDFMDTPIDPLRFCVYPQTFFKLNINKYCEQKFGHSKIKHMGCKNSYCNFCCDESRQILGNQNKKIQGLSKNFSLPPKLFSSIITDADIRNCKKKCNQVHKIDYPIDLPPPPRDKQLGKTSEYPGKSCSDIKKWGDKKNKSGEYWLEYGSKNNKAKVFCDMETDGGGWTLFFNYLHFPGQDISIDSSRIPENLKTNSHINLKELGLSNSQISEIRFFCTERLRNQRFIHFKVSNTAVIDLAISGDQKAVRKTNDFIKNGLTDLKFPNSNAQFTKWERAIGKDNIRSIDTMNESSNGGFWDTPFGSQENKSFWTVKGNVSKGGRFECGSYHNDGVNNMMNSLVQTHHSVWFRGPALSNDDARERYARFNKK